MAKYPQIKPIADTGVLVEFGSRIDDATHAQVLAMDAAIDAANIHGVTECIPAYAALYVGYDNLAIGFDALQAELNALLNTNAGVDIQGQTWRIPVCYDAEFAPDMDALGDKTGLDRDTIIAAHSSARYKVYMYGFAPGYAYLGGVPKPLQTPRKSTPVMGIAPRSVMVAGEQSLITTITMPSGWWVIGKSGINPLNTGAKRAFLFDVGDTVCFEPVSKADLVKHGQG